MIKKKVLLDSVEKKLIEIAYASNEKALNKKFDWKVFIATLSVAVLSLFILLFYESFGIPWLFSIIILMALVILHKMGTDYPRDRKEALSQKEQLSRLKDLEEVEIYECSCTKAFYLFDSHLEGSFYIFEIAEDKCVAFVDYHNEMRPLLPNSKFSFFVDERLSGILGENIKVYGERFGPYKFNDGEPFWGERSFPEHLKVMNCSLEGYLEGILSE
jgi:hypothetical protein